MKDLVINIILVHIVLSFVGRGIKYYVPQLSNNPVVETLNMNQRKLVTSSLLIGITVIVGSYMLERNIKIKGL